MSNNDNYIQKNEIMQQICDKPHVYKITNLINQKYYYGVHRGHNTANYMGSGELLKKAYEKYGIENFKKEIIKEFETEAEAYAYEKLIVDENMIHVNNPMCYNLKEGGLGQTSSHARDIAIMRRERGDTNFGFDGIDKEYHKELSILGGIAAANAVFEKYGQYGFEKMTEIEKFECRSKGGVESSKKQKENGTHAIANMTFETRSELGKKNKGEKKPLFYCPYDMNIKKYAAGQGGMAKYIEKNYPNEKQWNDYKMHEKEIYRVIPYQHRSIKDK